MKNLSINSSGRLQGMDALRSLLMILVVVAHTALGFSAILPMAITDGSKSVLYDIVFLVLQSFGVPAFFVLSGFFMHMNYDKYTVKEFFFDKVRKLLLPLFASWLFVCPLMYIFSMHYRKGVSVKELLLSWLHGRIYFSLPIYHLWFLYYLFLMCMLLVFVTVIRQQRLFGISKAVLSLFEKNMNNPTGIIGLFSIISFLLLLPNAGGMIPTELDLYPDAPTFLFYFLYFIIGFVLYRLKNILNILTEKWVIYLVFSVILISIRCGTMVMLMSTHKTIWLMLTDLSCALYSWMMIFGLLGLCNHYMTAKNNIVNVVSGSSYWLYLVHPPVVYLFRILASHISLPHPVKFVGIIVTVMVLLLATYHYFIRYTIIGRFLSGKYSLPFE